MTSFNLGQVVATPNALDFLLHHGMTPAQLIERHARGDWGDLDTEDKCANDNALEHGGRLFSSYRVGTAKVWIISEADRSATTVLLPEDY